MPAKILYLQRCSTDFRSLSLSSKILRVGIWEVRFKRAGILLVQWQGENFAHEQHLKFCHFQSVHCASKNPISTKVFKRFSKSLPQLEDVEGGHLGVKFRCASILPLQWQGEDSALGQLLKFCPIKPVHFASKNPISPKVLNRFSKSFPQLEDLEGEHLGGKLQVRRYFTFAMAMWKLGGLTTFEILQFSTCILCQQKSYISKGAQPIFEVLASARRSWGWAFGRYVSSVQVFYLCNGKVKTLRVNNIWNFATFNLYTVPAKILYLQRYSNDFRNLCLSSKMLRVSIWVESFNCGGILRLQWQWEIFVHWKQLKFCHIQPVHFVAKILYLQRYSTDFRNFPSARRCWWWAFGWEVSSAQVINVGNRNVKTLCIDYISNFATFNLYSVPAKILYLQRYSTDFRNLCLSSNMLRVDIWVEIFKCAGN